jgi:predicted amidophosphoribosyltransferase
MINSPISFDHNGIKGEAVIEYNQTIERILFRYKEDKDICMSLSFFYHCKKYFKKHKDWIFLVVPSSDDKIRERGFHPLHEMVKDYAYIVSMSLHKSKNIKQSQQHKIGRSARNEIIYCDDVTQFKNKKVVIIDDVMTPG